MNIICNNCIGARLYEVTKQQFPNPFMWMIINVNGFIKLVTEYDNIDFNNPKIELEKYRNTIETVLITLNNNIKLHYIHYVQDGLKDEPIKENTNILYKDILSYAKNKWISRLNRSIEDPIFLYSFNGKNIDDDYIKAFNLLITIKDKNVYILIHENFNIENYKLNDNIHVIKLSKCEMNLTTGEIANIIKNIFFN